MKQVSSMQTIGSILDRFNPLEDKYISREFQSYGVHIAETLGDHKHKALYIKLAKNIPRPILEKALQFCADANAKKKGALFMWKLKDLGAFPKKEKKSKKKSPAVNDLPF